MRIIVPAAGRSERFNRAGYGGPKQLLWLEAMGSDRHMRMLDAVLALWPRELARNRIHVGVRVEHLREFREAFPKLKIVPVMYPDLGQACTVREIAGSMQYEGQTLVLNSDVYHARIPDFAALSNSSAMPDCAVSVARMPCRPGFSYVDAVPEFTRCAERRMISPWALTGMYWFRSVEKLVRAVDRQVVLDRRHEGEFYLSGALDAMQGTRIAAPVPSDAVHDLGTPSALKETDMFNLVEEQQNVRSRDT